MPITIDASSPAIAVQSVGTVATVVTGSFTPPAGSVLAIRYSANTIDPVDPGTPTITDSLGAHLTYNQVEVGKRPDAPTADGQVASWTAVVPAGTPSMTVTVTNGAGSGNRHAALLVLVLTGVDTTTPVGQHGKSSATTATTSIAASYTATRTGSLGLLAVADWFDAGAESAGGTGNTLEGSADVASNYTYAFLRRTSPDGVAGAATTVTATMPSSTNIRWTWLELLPELGAPMGGQPMPAQLFYRFAGRRMSYDIAAPSQAVAERGQAQLAILPSATAVKVAPQAGRALLAVVPTGAGRKVAPEAGTAQVLLSASGVEGVGNARAQTGRAVLAPLSTGTAAKRAPEAGSAQVLARGLATGVKVAPQTGRVVVLARGTAAAIKISTPTSSAAVLLRATGAATNHVAVQAGRAVIALTPSGVASNKVVGAAGRSMVVFGSTAMEGTGTSRAQTGRAVLVLGNTAAARKSAVLTGTAMLALTGRATAVKRQAQAGTAQVLARASGAQVKKAVSSGTSLLPLAPSGRAAKRAAAAGRAAVLLSTIYTKPPDTPTRVPLGDRLEEILNQLISFTMQLGIFDKVQGHEPKSAPRNGLTAALWLQAMAPAPGASGLDSTSLRVSWFLRIYQNFLSEPQDSIDPKVMKAMAAVMEALTGNFDLDVDNVRAIDVLGAYGQPMAAEAGYLPDLNGKIFRCMTLTIPVIVNDAFEQVA